MEIKDSRRFLKEHATNKLIVGIQTDDHLRTTQLVNEFKEVDTKLIKPLFLSKLRDELDYIAHCKEATDDYKNNRLNNVVRPKVKKGRLFKRT